MNRIKHFLFASLFIAYHSFTYTAAQSDSLSAQKDSVNMLILENYRKQITEIETQRQMDSINRENLEKQLASFQTTDNLKKEEIQKKLDELYQKEHDQIARKKAHIDSLRNIATGFPVMGILNDTLFLVYTRIGSCTARVRADNISARIKRCMTMIL